MLCCKTGNCTDICDSEQRISRTFDKYCLYFGSYFRFKLCNIRRILNGIANSEMIENLIKHAECSAVNIA